MKTIFIQALLVISLFLLVKLCVSAQHPSSIVSPDDAVVTGFSLTVNTDTKDANFIDQDGPVVKVFHLPSSGEFGPVSKAEQFVVKAEQVGQVFGVAIDNAANPNIYVAATAAYGLAIYQAGKGRLDHGGPGAQFVPGLFGPMAEGGGPNSIWRIDGKTGAVSLFADVVYQGIENSPAALGGLAFDPISQQIFVANRTTGMIHRFTLDGLERGIYDHGIEGLSAEGKETVAFDPSKVISIKNPNFDVKNPETWGFAPIERRVFALAVYNHRLYYSASGSEIWSVGIATDGAFANDARFELDSPPLETNIEISAIAFDDYGVMYIAERGFPTANIDFIDVAKSGKTRVLRFQPKKSDSGTKERWILPGEEYAIGMEPNYQNSQGGVGLSCNNVWATTDNEIQGNARDLVKPQNSPPEKSWFINFYNGKKVHGNLGNMVILKNCLQPVTPAPVPVVPSTSVVPSPPSPPLANLPGTTCPLGTILFENKCIPQLLGPPPSICLPFVPCFPEFFWFDCLHPCADFWFNDVCIMPPFCPGNCCFWGTCPGFNGCMPPFFPCNFGNGFFNECFPMFCPPWVWDWGFGCHCHVNICGWPSNCFFDHPFFPHPWLCPNFFINGFCDPIWCFAALKQYVAIKLPDKSKICPPQQKLLNGQCVDSIKCPPGKHRVDGKCISDVVCEPDERLVNGKCVSEMKCGPHERLVNGICIPEVSCSRNERLVNGVCIPEVTCGPRERLVNGKCIPEVTCGPRERLVNGVCIPEVTCGPDERLVHGKCVPEITCKPNERLVRGKCVPEVICGPNERLVRGKCIPEVICGPKERLVNGNCVPMCKENERLVKGQCIPNIICKPYERLVNGKCVPVVTCKPGERLINGKCVSIIQCQPYQRLIDGKCVTITQCQPNERLVNGMCVPIIKCKPDERLLHGRCVSIKDLSMMPFND